MQRVTINYSNSLLFSKGLHVIVDGKDIGVLDANTTGAHEFSNDAHEIYFVYVFSDTDNINIRSKAIYIPEVDDDAPEKIEYIYNVTVVKNSVSYSERLSWSFQGMFMSKQESATKNAEMSFSIRIEQSQSNMVEVNEKIKINQSYIRAGRAMKLFVDQFANSLYGPLDFSEIEKLSDFDKSISYMQKVFLPATLNRAYGELIRNFIEKSISLRLLYMHLVDISDLPFAENIVMSSLNHAQYMILDKGDINSVIKDNVISELERLSDLPFERENFKALDISSIINRWENRPQYDYYISFEQSTAKELMDEILRVDKAETYFDELKRCLLIGAMNEKTHPELLKQINDIREIVQDTFQPVAVKNDSPIPSVTVDMIIADAIHYSNSNSIDLIDEELSIFLDYLCPLYELEASQYGVLQEVFAWLKAYKQETMILTSMVKNNIPINIEQEERLNFLNTKGISASSANYINGITDNRQKEGEVLHYDYRFMNMSDSEIAMVFNSLSLESKTIEGAIVVEEWRKQVELRDVKWDCEQISKSIGEKLKNNFGDKYTVAVVNAGVLADGWTDTNKAILVSESNEQGIPWLAYIISGEQLVLSQTDISIYTVYQPENDRLNPVVYERNQEINNRIIMLKKKQNPKINSINAIVNDIIVKDLEEWANSSKVNNIYD